ncbi:MAG: hypothetical protein JXA14_17760 [Anaerolineae bacterium]|nr:hypothetical protein [Anaerolineae bacterium]
MSRRFSILMGVLLILIGGLALAFTLAMPMLGISVFRWGSWRLWPLVVVGTGLIFVLSPFLVRGKRGLGGLFIPGVPILATGGILLYASLLDAWDAWEWLWPVEVLAVALGFLFAAITMRVVWLLIPAIIIGANGLVLQFCAITGFWESWAVLWAVEPLSVGLAFLIVNLKARSKGLFIAGAILCAVAALGMIGMSALFPGWILISALGPATLLFVGFLLLINSLLRRPVVQEATAESV